MPAPKPPSRSRPGGRARPLPAYALYGDHRLGLADPLHCESIAERSRLHGWEIRPHRHAALFQWLFIERGAGRAFLDGRTLELKGPAFVSVPALTAHGFQFRPDVEGVVFTVAEPHLAALLQPHPGLAGAVMRLGAGALAPRGRTLGAAEQLRMEALADAAWRGAALDAALLQLAVELAREAASSASIEAAAATRDPVSDADIDARANADARAEPPTGPPPRALAHVQRLRALVDAEYRRHPSQAVLAARLGITPTQLNRACQQVLGRPALAVLHARLELQARRELAYTQLPIKLVAFELGFRDAAYFTRFFRRLAGRSPSAWRAAHQAAASPQVPLGTVREPAQEPEARVPRPANREDR